MSSPWAVSFCLFLLTDYGFTYGLSSSTIPIRIEHYGLEFVLTFERTLHLNCTDNILPQRKMSAGTTAKLLRSLRMYVTLIGYRVLCDWMYPSNCRRSSMYSHVSAVICTACYRNRLRHLFLHKVRFRQNRRARNDSHPFGIRTSISARVALGKNTNTHTRTRSDIRTQHVY